MTNVVNGLILAGGKSSRMGSDKSLINYHGKPQRDHLVDLLKPFCQRVFISVERNTPASHNSIPDHFDLNSPLNGILSAFHFDADAAWISVPIDMPNIDIKAIEYLLVNRNPQKIATCFEDGEANSVEPLFTLWEKKASPCLLNFFNIGGSSLQKFLLENDAWKIRMNYHNVLVNVNTKEERNAFFKQFAKTIHPGK